jgi:hypothetical protein
VFNLSPGTIALLGNIVATALLEIAAMEQFSNPTLAVDLVTAANALKAACDNWTTGSSLALINDAAQVASAILASIPQTAMIAPFIPVAIAVLDMIIAAASGNTLVAANASIPHRLFRSRQDDFKTAWNKVANSKPELKAAVLP